MCELIPGCPFFNGRAVEMPLCLAERLKGNFCLGNYGQCARYMVAMAAGHGSVPQNLHPGDLTRALNML